MRELNTIQKREKLNTIYATDEKGNGGANHEYHIVIEAEEDAAYDVRIIKFQKGPRKDINSTQGIIDSDLLEIVRDRLKDFQAGPLATKENEHALTHIEEALMWMNRRVEDRIERNLIDEYDEMMKGMQEAGIIYLDSTMKFEELSGQKI